MRQFSHRPAGDGLVKTAAAAKYISEFNGPKTIAIKLKFRTDKKPDAN